MGYGQPYHSTDPVKDDTSDVTVKFDKVPVTIKIESSDASKITMYLLIERRKRR
jgi:hypothetical protein